MRLIAGKRDATRVQEESARGCENNTREMSERLQSRDTRDVEGEHGHPVCMRKYRRSSSLHC